MATSTPISILKSLFTTFFNSLKVNSKDLSKFRFNDREYNRQLKKAEEAAAKALENSKTTILSFNGTILSVASLIGVPGINAFNAWLREYGTGTGPLSPSAITALQQWYNRYVAPLK